MRKIWHDDAWEEYKEWQSIDKKNRLIFRVADDAIEIAQCGGHYDDK